MKLLLPIAVVVAAALGGGGVYVAKSQGLIGGAAPDAAEEDAHDAGEKNHEKKKKKKAAKKGGHGDKHASPADSYMKFSRQFVVPIVKGGEPQLMMLFDVNLALAPDMAETVYAYEAPLRDALLTAMFELAGMGLLQLIPEDAEARTLCRQRLLAAARSVVHEGIEDVLLVDVAMQRA